MQMRYPSIPLIAVDPYFSVWSHDQLNDHWSTHWTGSRNAILGTVTIDGESYRFLGEGNQASLKQESVTVEAMTTRAVFSNEKIRLTALFTSPMLVTKLYYASRPVSYLQLSWEALDSEAHTVTASIACSDELVLNQHGEGTVQIDPVSIPGVSAIRMGNREQKILHRGGDNIRIDWGYLYLGVRGEGSVSASTNAEMDAIEVQAPLSPSVLFLFAYDDIDSMVYFHEHLQAYWKKDGKTIEEAIGEAAAEYETLKESCDAFASSLCQEALTKGNAMYADLLALAYRQVMAAHKLVVDKEGNNLYISKECFSNGCAATVDVTYPSAPMFLRYNTELLKGMLRAVFRYARSEAWTFDFAPHDVGVYPLLNGQVYCENKLEGQMPIEECGNVLCLAAAISEADGNADFARDYMDLFDPWSKYLETYGEDPGNQLCTDDFAGHMAHNCNLSIKAIMGLAGYSRILSAIGREEDAQNAMAAARRCAASFLERAANPDGSYRLAFDREGTFSLKYNAIWDKLWNTQLFPASFYEGEMLRYYQEAKPFGIPLDNRSDYTKSDWEHWAACMGDSKDFHFITSLLWHAYHSTDVRAPMTDWYYASTAKYRGFRHRTVQGGLFMKLLFP